MRLRLGMIVVVTVVGAALVVCPPVKADASKFDFNFNSLANGANNGKVQTYMDGLLGASGKVVVTGSQASTNYNGDGHVVGPVTGKNTVTSLTLGTSDGGTQHAGFDTFIENASGSNEITMTFSVPIYSVSFDYEIFPDGTCPTGKNCGSNWPDFTFMANGKQVFETLAVEPGQPGAPYTHSPASGAKGTELAPQYLGESGTYYFPNGVTSLQFVDWPATIGVDNLQITTTTPEPGTMFLFSTGLAGLSWLKRKKQRT